MKKFGLSVLAGALVCGLAACSVQTGGEEVLLTPDTKDATDNTKKENEEVYALLDFEDKQELEFAQRGLIAAPDHLEICDDKGAEGIPCNWHWHGAVKRDSVLYYAQ